MSHTSCKPTKPWAACLLLVAVVQSGVAAAQGPAVLLIATVPSVGQGQGGLPTGGDQFRARMLSWNASPSPAVVKTKTVISAQGVAPLSISSPFGWRRDPIRGIRRIHGGIDLPGWTGTRIYATGVGTVTFAGWMTGYGNLVQIDHPGGVRTRYGHLSRILVSDGARVGQGELIGHMGSTGRSTGSHLHYEVRVQGVPVNPMAYMGQAAPNYYETAWGSEALVIARWTGWQVGENAIRLPEARIP